MGEATETLLSIRDLTVRFRVQAGEVEAVRRLDLEVRPGETLAIVGESGSGKSQTMMEIGRASCRERVS
jgi:oligopeptide transport system ATP-binding protein